VRVKAEDVASTAATLHVPDMAKQFVVGSAITANHLRSVTRYSLSLSLTCMRVKALHAHVLLDGRVCADIINKQRAVGS
jgi:hypothetical protein